MTLKNAVGYFVVDVFAMPGAGRDERGTPVWKFRREQYEPLKDTLKALGFKVQTVNLVGRSYQGVGVPHAVGGPDQSLDISA